MTCDQASWSSTIIVLNKHDTASWFKLFIRAKKNPWKTVQKFKKKNFIYYDRYFNLAFFPDASSLSWVIQWPSTLQSWSTSQLSLLKDSFSSLIWRCTFLVVKNVGNDICYLISILGWIINNLLPYYLQNMRFINVRDSNKKTTSKIWNY